MADFVDLAKRRPPVHYTVRLKQDWEGGLSVYVEDIQDDPRSRMAVADALEEAARIIRENE